MRLLLSTAIVALSAGVAFAQDLQSSNSTISVQGGTLANQPVSFGNSGRILNNGFGTGSLVSSIGVAQYGASGFAFMTPTGGGLNPIASSGSGASVDSTFTRQVETSGSSIGIGTLTVAGTAQNTFSGDVDASSDGEIRTIDDGTPVGGSTLTTSAASTDASASLGGSGLTSSGLQLTGTTSGFVGTGANEVAGTQRAVALGTNQTTGTTGSAQTIDPFVTADLTAGTLGNLVGATTGQAGLVFVFDDSNSTIGAGGALSAAPSISGVNMTIPNLGGGSILVESNTNGSTTGFFGAGGSTSFGQIVTP